VGERPGTPTTFIHPSGDVACSDAEVEPLGDESVRVRFSVTESTWERLQRFDIFGARSRRRIPDQLDGAGEVVLTVQGSRLASDNRFGWEARDFEIVSAMRDHNGQMSGMLFASAPAWHRAIDSLVQMGFVVDGETDEEISATTPDGTNCMISVYGQNRVAVVVFGRPLPGGSSASTAALSVVNALNVSFIIGSVSLAVNEMQQEFLLAKAAVPMIDGVDVPAVLDAYVVGLSGLVTEVEPDIVKVVSGQLSVVEAVRRLT
jgi:hypothetical protein